MVPASSFWELLLRQLKIPFLSRRASHWYEWNSARAEGWRMDKETESLWQGARGRLNSQIAEASRGISCTIRTGCRVNSACAEAYVLLWFCPLQLSPADSVWTYYCSGTEIVLLSSLYYTGTLNWHCILRVSDLGSCYFDYHAFIKVFCFHCRWLCIK